MGYFDSSDEESDYEDNNHSRKVATKKKKPSFLDDSDSDSDDDESNIDFDDSFLGSFRKKQAKAKAALEKQKQFEQDATETTQPEEFTETAQDESEQVVYRETTTDWVETLRLLRKKTSRNKRGAANVQFKEVLVTELLEYNQYEDSVRSVNDETHEAQDHNETPWYEEEYEELPWHMQPDLDEDDAITALCKKVLAADKQQQQPDGGEAVKDRLSFRAAAVEASVIGFALKLKSRLAVGKA